VANLSAAQAKMLRSATEHPDGTVLSSGFNRGPNASSTATSLLRRGLIEFVRRTLGYDVWRITGAGRSALSTASEEATRG
jgi:hypothetical protein